MAIIKDGTGSGNELKVDNTNRLAARVSQEDFYLEAAKKGEATLISSGLIAMTSATASAVLYFKNNSGRALNIEGIIYSFGSSTGGTADSALIVTYLEPTGLSATAGDAVIINPLLGDSTVFTHDSEVGAEAVTVTGGTAIGAFFQPLNGTITGDTKLILPTGKSVAIAITPPAGNTFLLGSIILKGYYERED